MKKSIVSLLCFCLLLALLLSGCGTPETAGDKLRIVASLFPQFDFAREICGDKADITLLLPPGVDSHSFEPTPSDIVRIGEADVFLFTGSTMEPWAAKLSEATTGQVVDVSEGAKLLDGNSMHKHEDHSSALPDTDPHIWTNPQNAIVMVQNICATVCAADPENSSYYEENAQNYIASLSALDNEIENAVQSGKRKKIMFGGHFAMRYFTERYGITYEAAFDSCSGETEPSPAALMHIIEEMKSENIPVIYFEELSTPRTASLIAEETGAQMLLLHSCHNLAPEEANETYLSLMRKNLENLKIGLN